MTSQADFYRERAAEMMRAAEAANLPNVRERCERSAAAWADMADRAERGERLRVAEKERKESMGLVS